MPEGHLPEGSVVITPTDMYRELRGVHDEVKHLSSIIDPALAQVREDIGENKTRVEMMDSRLRSVEARVWVGSGIAIAAGAGGGWLLSILVSG